MKTALIILLSFLISAEYINSAEIIMSEERVTSLTNNVITQPKKIIIQPEIVYTVEDQNIFYRYLSYISDTNINDVDEILEKSALFFLEKPYVAHTLETEGGDTFKTGGRESVVVNLREFDCTTFVETVIALTQTVRSKNPTFKKFIEELKNLRYRGGVVKGYSSRLHYMTDWFYDNEKKGVLKNISKDLGGITENKTINFMSNHRDAYKQLKLSDKNLHEIIEIESDINARGGFSFLPKSNIAITAPLIPHMSIIAFTTTIDGLDVSHVGFAFQKAGELTFIHASTLLDKIVIDKKTLSEYCNGQNNCTGIIVGSLSY